MARLQLRDSITKLTTVEFLTQKDRGRLPLLFVSSYKGPVGLTLPEVHKLRDFLNTHYSTQKG